MPADYVKLRFLRPHGAYRKGDVIQYPVGPARGLVAAGACEFVRDEPQLIETAMLEQRAETADVPRQRGRRGK